MIPMMYAALMPVLAGATTGSKIAEAGPEPAPTMPGRAFYAGTSDKAGKHHRSVFVERVVPGAHDCLGVGEIGSRTIPVIAALKAPGAAEPGACVGKAVSVGASPFADPLADDDGIAIEVEPQKAERVSVLRKAAEAEAMKVLDELRHRPMTHRDFWRVLSVWKCSPTSKRRRCAGGDLGKIDSDTFGLVRDNRREKGELPKYYICKYTAKYPAVMEVACRYLETFLPEHARHFRFSTFTVNKNVACARHRDSNNSGPSAIVGLGNYEGGQLRVWPEDPGYGSVHDLNL